MKTALVYFTEISKTVGHIGGSEMLLFLIIQELQRRGYYVTVALQSGGDVVAGSKDYGVTIDLAALKVIHLSEGGRFLRLVDRHLKFLWQWRLRRLGPKYDVCISCANVVDFGRLGVHFVYMLTIDEKFKEYYWGACENWWKLFRNRLVFLRDSVVAFLSGVRMPAEIVRNSKEIILANSNYVKKCIESYYKCNIHDAFYPPTVFEPNNRQLPTLENYDIAYIGRFQHEKRVVSIIDIVKQARDKSGINFRLRLAGHCPKVNEGVEIRELAEKYPWVILEGTVVGESKACFLSECRFAIHGCKVEAFGISITEYLKAGLVPIVPIEGGSSEVVGLDDLVYNNDDVAVDILIRLATDKAFYKECLILCIKRGKEFTADAYINRQNRLLNEFEI
jgi:glycosyltransferase involved in cell wall biosynthesis